LRSDIKSITPELIRAKRRIGLRMVTVYLGVYSLFVMLHVVFPEVPGSPCFGVSAGLVGGVALMFFAVLMALVYHVLCTKVEKRLTRT